MEGKGLMWTLVVLVVIGMVANFVYIGGVNSRISNIVIPTADVPPAIISDQDKADIVNAVLANLPASQTIVQTANGTTQIIDTSASPGLEGKIDRLLSELDDDEESKALELALEELETKDFKRAVQDVLNENNESVDSYKDIERIFVSDQDVEVSGEDAEVELEIKVYYFNDGDDDEEDLEKARLVVSFEVEDLDADDDFSDAELVGYNEDDFEVIKLYT